VRPKSVAIVTNNTECEKHIQYYSTLEKYVQLNGWQVVEIFDAERVLICACGFHDFMLKKVESMLQRLKDALGPRSLHNRGDPRDGAHSQAYRDTFDQDYAFCRGSYREPGAPSDPGSE
jgi:hypothetical protein